MTHQKRINRSVNPASNRDPGRTHRGTGRRNPHSDGAMTKNQHLRRARRARIIAFFKKNGMMPQRDIQYFTTADRRMAFGLPS